MSTPSISSLPLGPPKCSAKIGIRIENAGMPVRLRTVISSSIARIGVDAQI